MSTIQVKNVSDKTYTNIGRQFMVELESGKHSACICISRQGVQVIVQNAAHKCWRGMGKHFSSLEQALSAYKTETIRAMILEAAEMEKTSVSIAA